VVRITRMTTGLVLAAMALSAATAPLLGQAPQDIVAVRQESMKARASAALTLARMLRGDVPWNAQAAQQAAERINAEARKTSQVFPAGTGPDLVPQTKALPAIWQDRADFDSAARTLVQASQRLAELAQANDEAGFRTQFQLTGQSCTACHEKFRKPE
jgi:cytochrome c556